MNMRTITVSVAIFILAAFFFYFEFTFSVAENQLAVRLDAAGKVARSDYTPGLHFMIPVTDRIKILDRRIVNHDFAEERFMANEGEILRVETFAKWQINDASSYYQTTQGNDDVIAQRIGEFIRSAIKDMIAKHSVQQTIAAERNDFVTELFNIVAARTTTLGVRLVDVRIRKLALPESNHEAVYAGMRNSFKKSAASVRAQGEASAQEIRAQADRESVEIRANAARDAAIVRGEGDAKAAAIYANAYRANADFYSFYRSLQAYRASLGKPDDVLVLSPDSEFFKYFNKSAAR
jgi:membrane protease subunit HflC